MINLTPQQIAALAQYPSLALVNQGFDQSTVESILATCNDGSLTLLNLKGNGSISTAGLSTVELIISAGASLKLDDLPVDAPTTPDEFAVPWSSIDYWVGNNYPHDTVVYLLRNHLNDKYPASLPCKLQGNAYPEEWVNDNLISPHLQKGTSPFILEGPICVQVATVDIDYVMPTPEDQWWFNGQPWIDKNYPIEVVDYIIWNHYKDFYPGVPLYLQGNAYPTEAMVSQIISLHIAKGTSPFILEGPICVQVADIDIDYIMPTPEDQWWFNGQPWIDQGYSIEVIDHILWNHYRDNYPGVPLYLQGNTYPSEAMIWEIIDRHLAKGTTPFVLDGPICVQVADIDLNYTMPI